MLCARAGPPGCSTRGWAACFVLGQGRPAHHGSSLLATASSWTWTVCDGLREGLGMIWGVGARGHYNGCGNGRPWPATLAEGVRNGCTEGLAGVVWVLLAQWWREHCKRRLAFLIAHDSSLLLPQRCSVHKVAHTKFKSSTVLVCLSCVRRGGLTEEHAQ